MMGQVGGDRAQCSALCPHFPHASLAPLPSGLTLSPPTVWVQGQGRSRSFPSSAAGPTPLPSAPIAVALPLLWGLVHSTHFGCSPSPPQSLPHGCFGSRPASPCGHHCAHDTATPHLWAWQWPQAQAQWWLWAQQQRQAQAQWRWWWAQAWA